MRLIDWTSNGDHQYTVTRGPCQALVWQHVDGDWAAIVSLHGSAVSHDSFPTLEEAHAWCEGEIAALAAAGQCAQ